jgi:hypothetical protein
MTQDKGLYAPYSIIRAGEKIFFYAGQGFHKIEPGGVPEQIGREKVDRTFLADLDKGNLQLFVGAADPRSTRVYWAYKSVSGAVGTYDKLLGYDFLLDRFFPVSATGEYLLGISQTGLTLENLDSISSSLDALDAEPRCLRHRRAARDRAVRRLEHVLGFFSGTNLEATIESAEQGTDENRITVRGFRPDHRCGDAVRLGLLARYAPRRGDRRNGSRRSTQRTGRCDMCARHQLHALQGADSGRDVLDILCRRRSRPHDQWHAMTAYVPGITETDLKKIVLAIQQLAAGRSNAVGTVTLATGSGDDDVTTPNCAIGSTPILTPASANAATETGNGTLYVSAVANGSFTITHANSSTTGRTFLYALLG